MSAFFERLAATHARVGDLIYEIPSSDAWDEDTKELLNQMGFVLKKTSQFRAFLEHSDALIIFGSEILARRGWKLVPSSQLQPGVI